jgi:hypothetical protein
LNIFSEVKGHLTARQVAENYGLKVRKNGLACCPFHSDRHPSMKIDKNYHCFACGVGGDAIDYVSRLFGLSQYNAALKVIEDFRLPIDAKGSVKGRSNFHNEIAEREKIKHIKERFEKWCNQNIDIIRDTLLLIEQTDVFLIGKPYEIVFSEDYMNMLHAEPLLNYWIDILCTGSMAEKQELFIQGRKEVDKIATRVRECGKRIMGQNRESA